MKSLIVAICLLFSFAVTVTAQDQSEDAMMKAFAEYSTPGDMHKAMGNLVGTWDAKVVTYMDPSGKPTEEKATSTYRMIMDGRYLVEDVESQFMGQPFKGMGIYGYDNSSKKYISTWVDTMGTGMMTGTGTSPDGGKTINWTSTGYDPMAGKVQTFRSAMHRMSDDQYHFEMFGPGPDGKEMKTMEITYNRRK